MFNFKLQMALVRHLPNLKVGDKGENFVELKEDGLSIVFGRDGAVKFLWDKGSIYRIDVWGNNITPFYSPGFTPEEEDVDKLEKMSGLISRITGLRYPREELDKIRDRIKKSPKERITEALNREFPGIKKSFPSEWASTASDAIKGGRVGVAFFQDGVCTLDITKDCRNLAGATTGNGLIKVSFNLSNPMTRDTYEKLCKVVTIFSTELELPYPLEKMTEAYQHMLSSTEKERNQAVEDLRAAVDNFFIIEDYVKVERLREKAAVAVGLGMERKTVIAVCLSVLQERVLKSCVTKHERDAAHRAFVQIINL
jgi:hypothetical protein